KFRIEQGAVAVMPPGGGVTPIGPAGGAIATSDGSMALVIPAGALATTTNISVTPSAVNAATSAVLSPVFSFQPDGTTFSSSAVLTLKEDPASIVGGEAESQLVIKTAASSASDWTEVAGSTVDVVNHTVAAAI